VRIADHTVTALGGGPASACIALVVVTGDIYDVFGDGSAIIYSTPGHTPGHQSMLVRLRLFGSVILSGDVAHFWDNFCCHRVPHLNADKV